MAQITAGLEAAGVPVGPVNRLDQTFATDQVAARGLVVSMDRDDVAGGAVRLLGNPLHMSATPISYRLPPPHFGQDTEKVLGGL
jgi:crotonobetainyl-CoA:carnitine CoA-transferase CaiB-like acyl-CoA transferase